jgi:HK97 gp10 family phage protein
MAKSFEIEGLKELLQTFEKLKDLDYLEALMAGGVTLQKLAQENAPVKTGFLRASAETVKTDDNVEVRFLANYAFYQEYGTAKMKAHPFIRPAIDNGSAEILKAIKDNLAKQLKEVTK